MRKIHTTLCYLIEEKNILLAAKKRAFGEGKWNGVGGKQDPGETIEQTLVRETQEEICVTPLQWKKVAEIEFDEFYKGERLFEIMHVYFITKWDGIPTETEEMKPAWYDVENLPYEKMFPDDIFWLPQVLDGKRIKGFFQFDEKFNILQNQVQEVKKL